MRRVSTIPAERIDRLPAWLTAQGAESDVVLSTRIRLARNLAAFPFPSRASLSQRKEAFETVAEACSRVPLCRSFTVVNCATLGRTAQEFLAEERAVSGELVEAEGDRGFAGDDERRVGVQINEEDHLRLQALDSGFCAPQLYSTLDELDTQLGREVCYAYDRRRGFLTSCPTNAGTGLRVSFLMHLPGLTLTKQIDQVLQAASQMGMTARGFFGEHSEIVGMLFQISNQATMGATERDFLSSTENFVVETIRLEREARKRIKREARTEITDKVFRSFGILRHARTLSVTEFLNLSSALRIGIEMELLSGLSIAELNRLTLMILPAHLQLLYGRSMSESEAAMVRAEMVRGLLGQKIRDA